MSDEVSSFLRDVEQLKGRRTEEDEARSRELEEKILQERRERQARREERARSISPQKSSPANTPPPSSHRDRNRASQTLDGSSLESRPFPVFDSPTSPKSKPRSPDNPDDSQTMDSVSYSTSPTKENDSPFDSDSKHSSMTINSPSSGGPASRTLSWQRRPTSQSSERPKSRPLSMMAAENAAVRSTTNQSDQASEPAASRDQIAQALSFKDPAWFRQTPDRGQNSAAYRKNQVEDEDRMDMSAMKAELPGMSRPPVSEPEKGPFDRRPSSPAVKAELPGMSRPSISEPEKGPFDRRPSSPAISGKFGSPLPLTPSQRLEPTGMDGSTDRDNTSPHDRPLMSPPPGRVSPTRPRSPTKGMGGFVQSAMMKRTDSVKRWSVSSPQGLQRADSVASNRHSVDVSLKSGTAQSHQRRPSALRGDSGSRPTSSHGKDAAPSAPAEEAPPTEDKQEKQEEEEKTTPPISPSKTMDPRRWSPTKSASWMEAHLIKTESSPKPKATPPPSNQPSWMVELNKAKAQKANNPGPDVSRASSVAHKHEVRVGGLLRAPPMGTNVKQTPLPGAFPAAAASVVGDKAPISGLRGTLNKTGTELRDGPGSDGLEKRISNPSLKTKPDTPPKKDFRANLRPSQHAPTSSSGDDGNELKNVVGSLRRTKTQNFKAPDELKDNILRGKSALNATGGPKPSARKDEFKDAILQRKTEFQKAQSEGRGVTRNSGEHSEKPIPEGVAKRLEMSRTGSIEKIRSETAEESSAAVAEPTKRDSRDAPGRAPVVSPKPEKYAAAAVAPKPQPEPSTAAAPAAGPKVGGGRLADRFNPGLAGLLARGPPGMGPGPNKSSDSSGSAPGGLGISGSDQPSGPGPQLTHMTKNRARGPRRKAPSTTPTLPAPSEEQGARPSPPPERKSITAPPVLDKPSRDVLPSRSPVSRFEQPLVSPPIISPKSLSPKSLSPKPQPPAGGVISLVDSSKTEKPVLEDPFSPRGRAISLVDSPKPVLSPPPPLSPTKKIHEQVAAIASRSRKASTAALEEAPEKRDEPVSQPSSPKKLDVKRMSKFLDETGQQPQKPNVETPRPLSPQKTGGFRDVETPRPLSPQKTGGRRDVDSPRPLSPQKTGGRRDVDTPRPLSPQKTGGRRDAETPRPLSPQKTGGRPLPDPPASPPKQLWEDKPVLGHSRSGSVRNAAAMFQASAASEVPAPLSFDARSRSRSPAKSISSARPLPTPPAKPSPPPKDHAVFPTSPQPQSQPQQHYQQQRSTSAAAAASSPSPQRSPTKIASDVSQLLDEFFGPRRPAGRNTAYRADAAEILMRRPGDAEAKVQTHAAQLFRIGADGKKQPVPASQERVLFEGEMYLCSHTFTNESGRRVSEVYFWVGDEVPAAMAEDAHVFVNREARSLGGRLVKLYQGKESPEFLQALGGVVIVRRGSSNKYDSLAPSMLCGRRYQGQVTFDEVDFSPQSLCSGFAYLINQGGKCFLWKGKGSDVDELGCARLIGMESALMGELIEVEDGSEPDGFWDVFGAAAGASRAASADHWRLKPSYRKYCARLFRSDADSKQQIIEMHPFNQMDLDPAGIYVLDAFFEMYIVVGYGAQPQYASFRNALDFAQEYAILAAGMEDRPFVPISTIVLEGIPRDLKSVFRKWRDAANPTRTNVNASLPPSRAASPLGSPKSAASGGGGGQGLRRARSLRIVPLNQALMALAD